MSVIRIPVDPTTITVLGNRVKETEPMWTGLDLANAEPRTQSSLMLLVCGRDKAPEDVHLCVPWNHPQDTKDGIDGECRYRVRPRVEVGKKYKGKRVTSVAFERWDGKWWIAIRVEERQKTN